MFESMGRALLRMIFYVFVLGMVAVQAANTTYYVDATNGDDARAGTTPSTAWKTLAKVNGTTFGAGDKILLKAGSVWTGSLSPQGSGASGSPIVVDTFGSGVRPIINGNGAVSNAFSLSNQQYWEVNNLELTNDDNFSVENTTASRTGFRATATSGVVNHVYIKNCYIHDIDGNADGSNNHGGIIMPISGGARFNDVLIEGNIIRKIDRTGIEATAGGTAVTTNMVIRNNSIINTGGDAMIVQGCMKAVVEYNIADGCAARCSACCAGIWPWASDSTLFQFNEAARTVGGGCDRSGFDCDWKCRGTVFQYNYSHDNGGGFMLICSPGDAPGEYNYGSIIRYNISQNDQNGVIDLKGPGTKDTRIYNNTIYVGKSTPSWMLITDGNWGGPSGSTYIWNNIFHSLANTIAPFGTNPNYTYDNNCYYLPNASPLDTIRHKRALISDPFFESPGTASMGIQTVAGYKLRANSPCINSGIDMRSKGENPGTRDYFGSPIPAGSAVDIGASEYQGPFGPLCLIASPADRQIFASGTTSIVISARAWHSGNSTIAGVAFYQGTTKIGDGVNGTNGWSYAWNSVTDGVYTLTAVATDAQGATVTSSPVRISMGYRTPENPANVNPGIDYSYYEGTWSMIPDYSTLTPVATGAVATFSLTVARIADHFGIRFTGYVDVATDGVYTFFTTSDDGSNLYIGNTLVVNNDGSHGPAEGFGSIGLKAGKHALTVEYFEDFGGQSLTVSWQCATASIAKQSIPAARLYHTGSSVSTSQATQRTEPAFELRALHAPGSAVSVQYSLPAGLSKQSLTIRLLDCRGSVVQTLVNETTTPGNHAVTLRDSRSMAPGRYLCVMKVGAVSRTVAVDIAR